MGKQDVSALDVGHAYFELHHRLHRLIDRAMCAEDLSIGGAKVLIRLRDEGPMNQASLARSLGFAPRSVTDSVDALVRDGLVVRTEDPDDRRSRILALTVAGVDAVERAVTVRAKAMTEIFGSLTAAERATLSDLFGTIRTNLSTGTDCGNCN